MARIEDLLNNRFENLAEIALTGDPKDLAVKVVQSIPEPQLSLCKNLINDLDVQVSWHNADKRFWEYNPKYYLFRYVSSRTDYKKGEGYKKRNKKFRHPVHMNGADAIKRNWWGGADFDTSGIPLPPRVTEWACELEGQRTFLNMNVFDWARFSPSRQEPVLKQSHFSKFRGCNKSNTNHYFYLAIGIELPDTNGCPITFGPRSVTFALSQNRTFNDTDPLYFDKYTWSIRG